jgi:prepilin-type processing-associated H-X9-DG protein
LTDAGAGTVEFERITVHVTVAASGHVEVAEPRLTFEFDSDVQFGPRTPPGGGINVVFVDGSVRRYNAVGATLLAGDECLVFFLGGVPGELDPSDPAIAIVRDDPRTPGVIFVKLQMKQVFPQSLEFAVPGEIRLARSEPPPESPGVWFSLHYPRQVVVLDQAVMMAGFTARTFVGDDHNGWGSIVLALPEVSPLLFEPVFGVELPETETRPGYIVFLTASRTRLCRLRTSVSQRYTPILRCPVATSGTSRATPWYAMSRCTSRSTRKGGRNSTDGKRRADQSILAPSHRSTFGTVPRMIGWSGSPSRKPTITSSPTLGRSRRGFSRHADSRVRADRLCRRYAGVLRPLLVDWSAGTAGKPRCVRRL